MLTLWLPAFLLTQLTECPIYTCSQRPKRRWTTAIPYALIPSALTHPILWATWSCWPSAISPTLQIIAAEGLVVLVEALVWSRIQRRPLKWALSVSLCANTLSVLCGELLRVVL